MRRSKPTPIGDVLEEFFKRPGIAARVAAGRLPQIWQEVVGMRVAGETTHLVIENYVLHATIRSSVMRSELFYQREALKERLNQVAGVKFVNVVIIK